MFFLIVLSLVLYACQAYLFREERKIHRRRMGASEGWQPEDVDFWLARIESLPLPDHRGIRH